MTSKDIYNNIEYDKTERYYVYLFCDPSKPFRFINGDYCTTYEPFYCGKGTKQRIFSLKRNKAVNDKINSMKKRGVDVYISYIGPFDEETAFIQEKYFVDYFGRRGISENGTLLNLKDGGNGGKNPSAETRERLRVSHLGQKPNSGSFKKGRVPWNKDIPATEEQKKKNSDAAKLTYENGRNTWNKDKKYKLGSRSHHAKPVVINGILYETLREAEEKTGISLYLIKKNYLKEK